MGHPSNKSHLLALVRIGRPSIRAHRDRRPGIPSRTAPLRAAKEYRMNLIVKGLIVLAVGLTVAASADAGWRHRRPAPTTEYYSESQSGTVYYTPQQQMHNIAPRETVYRPSVPTYGWSFNPSDGGWGFRWNNSSGTPSPMRTYSWGYSPSKGWGFDWR